MEKKLTDCGGIKPMATPKLGGEKKTSKGTSRAKKPSKKR